MSRNKSISAKQRIGCFIASVIILFVLLGASISVLSGLIPQLSTFIEQGIGLPVFIVLVVFLMVAPALGVLANLSQVTGINLRDLLQRDKTSSDPPEAIPVRVVNPKQLIQPASAPIPPAPRVAPRDGISGSFPYAYLDLPIVGRDTELTEVIAALKAQTRVTLIRGFGGMGKTRLAAEVVDKLKASFANGVIWHTISKSTTPGKLTEDIRDHLGMDTLGPEDASWAELNHKAVLLVLDNAEDCQKRQQYAERLHAVDLRGGTRFLMTSCNLWPELEHVTEIEIGRLQPPDAVTMLKTLVDAQPKGHSPAGYEDQLAAAARFHPRLIWYAVKWLNGYPAQHVLNILTTLKGGDAEQALQDVVHKTVELVKEQEGGVAAIESLRRLTVTRGGFTFEAALALMEALTPRPSPERSLTLTGRGESESSPLDGASLSTPDSPRKLALLKQWGLVTLEGQRYAIDPLVIAAVGEDDSAHRPHYDFYKALANEHDEKQDYLGLDPESANLEAAFEWAMAAREYEDAFWLVGSVCMNFLANRGRFTQRLDWLERVATRLNDHTDESLKAAVQNSLGILYQNHPFGNHHDNLKRAITAYQAALVYYTPQAAPLDYAMTQNNLGAAYDDLAQIEDREANLKRAIEAYEAALVYRTPQAAPLDYAGTENNLGIAYGNLAKIEDREANLKRAITAFEAALVYYTPQAAPLNYAGTENNLGIAYKELAQIQEYETNLSRAVAAYEAALVYYTPQAAPLKNAMTQANLGNAYRDLAQLEDRETNLKRAITAYESALVYYTPRAAPLAYAMTQANIGLIQEDLDDVPAAIACWREAERYYRQIGHVDDADVMLWYIAAAEKTPSHPSTRTGREK